jgi:hypothetical protein
VDNYYIDEKTGECVKNTKERCQKLCKEWDQNGFCYDFKKGLCGYVLCHATFLHATCAACPPLWANIFSFWQRLKGLKSYSMLGGSDFGTADNDMYMR